MLIRYTAPGGRADRRIAGLRRGAGGAARREDWLSTAHGGTGSLITALRAGCRVVAMPRRFDLGEALAGDHQEEIVLHLPGARPARAVRDEATLADPVDTARARPSPSWRRPIRRRSGLASGGFLRTQMEARLRAPVAPPGDDPLPFAALRTAHGNRPPFPERFPILRRCGDRRRRASSCFSTRREWRRARPMCWRPPAIPLAQRRGAACAAATLSEMARSGGPGGFAVGGEARRRHGSWAPGTLAAAPERRRRRRASMARARRRRRWVRAALDRVADAGHGQAGCFLEGAGGRRRFSRPARAGARSWPCGARHPL